MKRTIEQINHDYILEMESKRLLSMIHRIKSKATNQAVEFKAKSLNDSVLELTLHKDTRLASIHLNIIVPFLRRVTKSGVQL